MDVSRDAVAGIPAGSMFDFGGGSAPTGYLLCDGSAVSRATYSRLFSVLSTTWGVGDGSTTFNVPDMRGRCSIGAGTGSGLTARALAGSGGEENHALSEAELATHTHTNSASGSSGTESASHTHPEYTNTGAASAGRSGMASVPTPNVGGNELTYQNTGTESASHTHTISVTVTNNSTGSGTAHNTMQPYKVVTKIIKF